MDSGGEIRPEALEHAARKLYTGIGIKKYQVAKRLVYFQGENNNKTKLRRNRRVMW
jgi:hypothetical protein